MIDSKKLIEDLEALIESGASTDEAINETIGICSDQYLEDENDGKERTHQHLHDLSREHAG